MTLFSRVRFMASVTLILLINFGTFFESRAFAQESGGSVLYVVLSGNGTCRRNVMSNVVPGLINTKLFDAFNRRMLTSGVVRKNDQVLYACYEWLSPQMQFYELGGVKHMEPILETELDDFVLARAHDIHKIVIIGHSHAGWRAMKLASSPVIHEAFPVPMILASLDPVSRVTCQKLREPGCREAPRDITQQEFETLHTKTTWMNIYHSPAAALGSGPMPAAHQNIHVMVNHMAMENNFGVWTKVSQFVRGHL